MDYLLKVVRDWVTQVGLNSTFWVGYSGGMDSHVLLHLLHRLRQYDPLKLKAVYINHRLSSQADAWGEHCKKMAEALQIEFFQYVVNAQAATGESPEAIARERRYQIFSQLLAPNDILLTAHHQIDQAETVLLQLLRGSGLKGLAAMPSLKAFAGGWHGRPLLTISQKELQQYALAQSFSWIEDESNRNVDFKRNFLRHEVFPLLEKGWPAVYKTLSRAAQHCAAAQTFIMQSISTDLAGSKPGTLSIKKILNLTIEGQQFAIRDWIEQQGFPLPSTIKMQHILKDMLAARSDKQPCVQWQAVELRRYADDLFIMPRLSPLVTQSFSWDLSQPLTLNQIGVLQAHYTEGVGLLLPSTKKVTVKFRQGGELCRLPGRKHHHTLKKLLQSWNVAPWLRNRIPLIYVEDQLAAIPNYFLAEEFMTPTLGPGWKLIFNAGVVCKDI